jgi:hypothetical protein
VKRTEHGRLLSRNNAARRDDRANFEVMRGTPHPWPEPEAERKFPRIKIDRCGPGCHEARGRVCANALAIRGDVFVWVWSLHDSVGKE